ncbi:hypothetical protein KKH23_10490, partial [Patescibacteria group bacterium]|nr:hypothetical protein [Patescibacteria group bacterium]
NDVPRPEQQNRPVYTTNWAYTELKADSVAGDVPVLARTVAIIAEEGSGGAGVASTHPARVILSLRSLSRGADFVPYFNFGDPSAPGVQGAQCQVGVTPNVEAIGVQALNSDVQTGVYVAGTQTAAVFELVQSWSIAAAYASQYYGQFRMFVRCSPYTWPGAPANPATVMLWGVVLLADNIVTSTKWTPLDSQRGYYQLYDLGVITIPPYAPVLGIDMPHSDMKIILEQYCSAIGLVIHYYDLILIPIDEKVVEAVGVFDSDGLDYSTMSDLSSRLVFDSTQTLRTGAMRTLLTDEVGAVTGYMQPITVGPQWFQASSDQRIWMVAENWSYGGQYWRSYHPTALKLLLKKVSLFRSLRGSR